MNKRKKIVLALIVGLILVSAAFVYNAQQKNYEAAKNYESIPSFCLQDIHGNELTDGGLMRRKSPIAFLFFDPDCGSCHYELTKIRDGLKAFDQSQLVFFSTLPSNTIISFLDEIQFSSQHNVFFLVDKNADLMRAMAIKGAPSSLVYDKNGHLTKRFDGPVKTETLIKYLFDE